MTCTAPRLFPWSTAPCNGFACDATLAAGAQCSCGPGWQSAGDFALQTDDTCAVSSVVVKALYGVCAVMYAFAWVYEEAG